VPNHEGRRVASRQTLFRAAIDQTLDLKSKFNDARWHAAQARYEQLRAAPRFAELVQKFTRQRGQAVQDAS
jgi:hypothetical protein